MFQDELWDFRLTWLLGSLMIEMFCSLGACKRFLITDRALPLACMPNPSESSLAMILYP